LRAALEEERTAAAQLRERLRMVRDRETLTRAQMEEKVERMTRQLDVQGMELQRMRKTAVSLREELRRLREAQSEGAVDAAQINRALLAELDALRATRLSETAELDELIAALDDHLTEAENA
jgi:methylthioribose-1-phosphate isomerase